MFWTPSAVATSRASSPSPSAVGTTPQAVTQSPHEATRLRSEKPAFGQLNGPMETNYEPRWHLQTPTFDRMCWKPHSMARQPSLAASSARQGCRASVPKGATPSFSQGPAWGRSGGLREPVGGHERPEKGARRTEGARCHGYALGLTLVDTIGGALLGHVRAFAVASEGQPRPNRLHDVRVVCTHGPKRERTGSIR